MISISWSVLLFAVVASIVTGVVFGLAPALHAGRADLTDALKEAARGSAGSGRQGRARRFLVVAEFALSLVLMVAATLLLRSFWDLLRVPLGFNPENVMAVRTRLPAPNDPKIDLCGTAEREEPFLREVLRRARTLPGVEEAALGDTAAIPLDQSLQDLKRISEGQYLVTFERRDAQGEQSSVVERSCVTPEYFHLMGIPLLRGRLFDDTDSDKSPQVAVINEAFARTCWTRAAEMFLLPLPF